MDSVEWMKINTLRWYGHVQRIKDVRMAIRVFDSEATGRMGRGKALMTWERRVEEHVGERVGRGRGTIESERGWQGEEEQLRE